MAFVKMRKAVPPFSSEDDRWAAVVRRDQLALGLFYYSVQTTGVYCRPACPSRLARRENVRFHSTCAEAEQAGFRPCKRCKPNEPALTTQRAAAVTKACRLIEAAEDMPNLDALAEAVGMSRFHFHRVFKNLIGVTPKAYATARRAQRVRTQLSHSQTVTEAIYGSGFNSNGRFYATSSSLLGMTPTTFRSGGTGESIRFAVAECSLGRILVAATTKGVCAILLGDEPAALVRDLEVRFPKAQLIGENQEFEHLVAKVVGFVEAPGLSFDLPLDVRGTAFQQRVWQALRAIPAGSTASYKEVAESIGSPDSVRAVAQACASNPIAVAIPCHRVVRNSGALSGYRWGVERKRVLLDREAAHRGEKHIADVPKVISKVSRGAGRSDDLGRLKPKSKQIKAASGRAPRLGG
ncbi:MAG TPA: bifunctional DNA-binding transcriptional regulator/O6-methylguanine-DNA methyltransferase Ada [Nitrospirales bacterium]|jgi:AraC family transcriptional regulator of adaptative response/methylated-DNA-[protein]-cysteine methyltransferase